jgi:LPS export ABC transporter permease LptG/LPS export ABC transporter permease LptF
MFSHLRISRYLLRELVAPILLSLALYMFVLLMNHLFLVAEKSLSKNLGFDLTLRLLVIGIPPLFVLATPMAVLLGTMIALGRLSSDNEWVALQGAGQGLGVLLRPVLIAGLVGASVSFGVYGYLVPRANYVSRSLGAQVLFSSNLASDLKPREFYDLRQGAVMFVEDIRADVTERRLRGVLLIHPDEKAGTTQLVMAKEGDLYPAPDRSGALLVDLFDGERLGFQRSADSNYQFTSFKRAARRRLEPPPFLRAMLEAPNKGVRDYSIQELWGEYREAKANHLKVVEEVETSSAPEGSGTGKLMVSGRRLGAAEVELHQRFALPLACLVLSILALPLAITRVRSGKGAGFAMSLIVILIYRVIFVLTRNQASMGKLSPAVGVWAANGVILIWAAIALWRLRRRELRETLFSRALAWAWGSVSSIVGRLGRRKKLHQGTDADPERSRTAEARDELASLGGTSTRFVGRLDRYVGLAYLRVLGFALASAYLIFGLVELQRLMEGVIESKQPVSLVGSYFRYFVPTVLQDVLPIACLVGAVVGFTLLARSSELIAMMASGVGLRRATYPVIGATILLCALLFLVQDRIAPVANRKAETIKDQIYERAPKTHGLPVAGRWGFGPEGKRLFHYRVFDPKVREFRELSVFTLDRETPRVLDHRYAAKARWSNGAWDIDGGWYRTFSPDTFERFDGSYRLELQLPRDWIEKQMKKMDSDLPRQLSVVELRDEIEKLNASGYDSTRLNVAYHEKYAKSTTPLVMVLLGLPFAFKVGRRGSLYGIGVALLLVLVYWAIFAVFNALGLETILTPAIAAWTPNVMFGLIGTYLLLYVKT